MSILSSFRFLYKARPTQLFTKHAPSTSVFKQLIKIQTFGSSHAETQEASDSDSDSDEEFNPKIQRGNSEFWRRKMRTFHGILDINKDGVISFDDFKILVDRFVYLGHLDPHHQKEFNEVVQNMWEERWGTISPYNFVTTEQYLEDMHHVVNDKQLRKKVHSFLPYLFKVAMVSFTAVDENLDGRVTMKEFVRTGRDFFLNEDQRHASKMFWGPLVK